MKEEWREIKGYEGLYQVSDCGRVKSLERKVAHGKSGFISVRERVLKTSKSGRGIGHQALCLSKDGTQETYFVHTLVLTAFVGPRPEGMECCHGTGGAEDNRLSNLSWNTKLINQGVHRLRDGTDCRGEKQGASKLTEPEVLEIYRRANKGENGASLASEFNVSRRNISMIKAGKSWSWLTNP
jgi:hypothetical protein